MNRKNKIEKLDCFALLAMTTTRHAPSLRDVGEAIQFKKTLILSIMLAIFILLTPMQSIAEPAPVAAQVEEPDADESPVFDAITEKPIKNSEEKKPTEPVKPVNEKKEFNAVILQGLNKITARSSKIIVPIGASVKFGTIEIIARTCWQSPPDEKPDNASLLEIYETKLDAPPAPIFLGWIFSSSPSISALEHPFYDITLIKCDNIQNQ